MPVSHGKLAIALLTAGLCLSGNIPAVQAQQVVPQSENVDPQTVVPEPALSKPRMLMVPDRTGRSEDSPRPLPKVVTGGRVQVDNLSDINVDEAGILDPETGAFGLDMWRGTPASLVARLLLKLPENAPSHTMHDLMRRLLLSPAVAPDGDYAGPSLISQRIEILIRTGDLTGADELLRALPDTKREPKLIELEADLGFLLYDNRRACILAEREVPLRSSSYWQKAYNFCQIINGRIAEASLGLSLMREMGETDSTFLQLADALLTKQPSIVASLTDPTPLQLAMIRVLNTKLPADVIGSRDPFVLRAVAVSSQASKELRLEAAERADTAGALPKATLRQLYASIEFSKEDRASPLTRADVEFGPMVRALLYHTALTQTVPTAKAEATARAVTLARDEGRYVSTVEVFEPVLDRIPPSADLIWFAPEAVRAFLVIGDGDRAEAWYQIMRSSANSNRDSQQALDRFRPIAWLFQFADQDVSDADMIESWVRAQADDPDLTDKAALLFNVMEAMGVQVPEKAWTPYITGDVRQGITLPSSGLWHRLQRLVSHVDQPLLPPARTGQAGPSLAPASGVAIGMMRPERNLLPGQRAGISGRSASDVVAAPLADPNRANRQIGETVLLSLIALGNGGPEKADPFVLQNILRALQRAGLKSEARALALDAVLARGL